MRKMAIVFVAVVSWPSLAWSQGVHERFLGTWVLDRIETRAESGDWTPAKTRFGSHPIGTLTYDPAGNMAVQIMRRDRPPLSSPGLAEGQSVSQEALALAPAEEKAVAFGKVAQPIRVAVTGTSVSPGIHDTLLLLGRERSLKRMKDALEKFGAAQN